MPRQRRAIKQRRPELAQLAYPSVLRCIASDFTIYPLHDYTAGSPYNICSALQYFEHELLDEIKEQYAEELEVERERILAETTNKNVSIVS